MRLRDGHDEGIFVEATALTHSTIKNNSTKGNASFGIRVAAGNTGNLIANDNFTNGGGNNDCQDDSVGGGTAGTANTWKNDKGKRASPPAICKKK